MKEKIYKRFHLDGGPILTWSINARKEPIAEVYQLDNGLYLALWAGTTAGYTRKTYKSQESADRAADREAVRLVESYFHQAEIVYVVD